MIELIRQGKKAFTKSDETYLEKFLADYLLANGVIVPPCKVGDTVYFAEYGYHNEAEIEEIRIDENGIMFAWVQYEVGVDITEVWDDGEFSLEDIGKTVFLTKEEAERELEKRNGNGTT